MIFIAWNFLYLLAVGSGACEAFLLILIAFSSCEEMVSGLEVMFWVDSFDRGKVYCVSLWVWDLDFVCDWGWMSILDEDVLVREKLWVGIFSSWFYGIIYIIKIEEWQGYLSILNIFKMFSNQIMISKNW